PHACTLSLHDALPISMRQGDGFAHVARTEQGQELTQGCPTDPQHLLPDDVLDLVDGGASLSRMQVLACQLLEERQQVFTLENLGDRKSTRLNSSHVAI